MEVFLLSRDQDVDWGADLPPNADELIGDLELARLFEAMAGGDEFLHNVVKRVVLTSVTDPDTITYRHGVLVDCLRLQPIVRELYDLAVEALRTSRKVRIGILFRGSPDSILRRSVEVLELLLGNLTQLRALGVEHAGQFRGEGFRRFFGMVADELSDDYLASIQRHLASLRMPEGLLMSAELGAGNMGVRPVLHQTPRLSWWERFTGRGGAGYSFEIHPRDEAGARALRELQSRRVNIAADALAQSADHVLSFFRALRTELAFYLGCANLHTRLAAKEEPVCLPEPWPVGDAALHARGLYDVCLSLTVDRPVVGSDLEADGKDLVLITGANEGGKSTFLRAVGLAQLMMQCGMFIAAESFAANVVSGIFTHFKREEDASMTHGKLDEELFRMSAIADRLHPGALLLCNESFASTNEHEGSEIARQVVRAATECRVKVIFVTHLYDLAHGLYRRRGDRELFLRAQRLPDGSRTLRIAPGEPLPTSYGEDRLHRVFATAS